MDDETDDHPQESFGDANGGNNFLPADIHDDDVLKILISTDNHIGYKEKCEVRGNDSLIAFEEVLIQAQKNDVDMILLGTCRDNVHK